MEVEVEYKVGKEKTIGRLLSFSYKNEYGHQIQDAVKMANDRASENGWLIDGFQVVPEGPDFGTLVVLVIKY